MRPTHQVRIMNPTILKMKKTIQTFLFAIATSLAIPASAQDVAIDKDDIKIGKKQYSPYLHQAQPDQVFWGDTHLHTSYSTDAGMIGNQLGPDEALRFAKGEKVIASSGTPARLIRPLDFLVVADHAENLGLAPMIEESNPELLKDPWGKRVHDLVKAGRGFEAYGIWGEEGMAVGKDPMPNPALMRSMWSRIVDAVDEIGRAHV